MTIKDTVRGNLRRLKQLDRITTNQALAKQMGVSTRTVNQLMSESAESNPRIDTVDLVAKTLGIETWMLLVPEFPFQALPRKGALNLKEESILILKVLDKATDEDRKSIREYAKFIINNNE